MKTKNNVQKAVLRTGAVIVSFILISFTVSAQDFWKRLITNSSFNEIAMAMIETRKESEMGKDSETLNLASESMNYSESALSLESWMFDKNYFNFDLLNYQLETDNPLQLEEWMIDSENFTLTVERDEPLSLENWMISDSYWNVAL